jgi:hypothetical protein
MERIGSSGSIRSRHICARAQLVQAESKERVAASFAVLGDAEGDGCFANGFRATRVRNQKQGSF